MERRLKSPADIEARCTELGFLPFFRCGIPGFSVEEMVAPEYWCTDEVGAWEWKGPVIREGHCAYGKLFARKAGFVSREWLPDYCLYMAVKEEQGGAPWYAWPQPLRDRSAAALAAALERLDDVAGNGVVDFLRGNGRPHELCHVWVAS